MMSINSAAIMSICRVWLQRLVLRSPARAWDSEMNFIRSRELQENQSLVLTVSYYVTWTLFCCSLRSLLIYAVSRKTSTILFFK